MPHRCWIETPASEADRPAIERACIQLEFIECTVTETLLDMKQGGGRISPRPAFRPVRRTLQSRR